MLRVINGERPPKPSCDPPFSEALWQYMTDYWTENSATRPATDAVVQHMGLNYVSWLIGTQFSVSPSTSGSAHYEEMEMHLSKEATDLKPAVEGKPSYFSMVNVLPTYSQ
jgi:hypothetical protein